MLGIPWDVDTEGLREYMSKFGELEDCIVLKVSSYYIIASFVMLNVNVGILKLTSPETNKPK